MDRQEEFASIARAIIDANLYMTLGTVDEEGKPWVAPVYFAPKEYREFYWISSPEAQHSRNLARQPHVSMVIFDSQVPVLTGQAVYMAARAEQVADTDLERGLETYPGRPERGVRVMTPEELRAPGAYRLFRATASQHWILDPVNSPDQRIPVTP